jgi:SAM-dependent methyltransferase
MAVTKDETNSEQVGYWNDQAGLKWVAMQRDLDAQLEPLGSLAMDRLAFASGERVLDVGCGAGATSLSIAARVAPGEVTGVDISKPLLARARERAAAVDNVRFEEADAQTMAPPSPGFDAVFSRFGVMFFADPLAAFKNLLACLRPGGRLGFVCWREMQKNPWVTLPLSAALPFLPGPPDPPVPGAPGPFGLADGARTRLILEAAGFSEIDVASVDSELVVGGNDDIETAVHLALQIGPLGSALGALDEDVRGRARAAVREAFAPHLGPRGVTLGAAVWVVTARRPSDESD